ncbi:hypothetical protein FRC03_008145 [Tulasnella sp. 419]|nr:hypothetical protein FRC03_008145 [Tulasnella sp. 419]
MSRYGHEGSTLKLYQMGGFRAQANQWEDEILKGYFVFRLSKTLFPPSAEGQPPECLKNGDGQVQLIFGIKKDGTSYLLVTRQQLLGVLRHYGLPENIPSFPPASRPSDFLSLSPAIYLTHESLNQTIKRHMPKANKKKQGRAPSDTSQANAPLLMTSDDALRDQIASLRSYFEHARIVHRAYHTQSNLQNMALFLRNWDGRISGLTAFSMTIWKSKEHKNVLDYGWSQLMLPATSSPQTEDVKPQLPQSVHLRNQDHAFLTIGTTPWVTSEEAVFKHGQTERLKAVDCKQRVQSLFDDILARHSQDPSVPHILLVYDEPEVSEQLEALGVDTSEWGRLFTDLLGPSPDEGRYGDNDDYNRESPPPSSRNPRSSWRPRDPREVSPRRSSTPSDVGRCRDSRIYGEREDRDRRRGPPQPRNEPLFLRTDSPPPPTVPNLRPCAPIYIVDIRRLFGTVTNRETYKRDLYDIPFRKVCASLSITSMQRQEGWSAGNDAEYLLQAWNRLSGGSTIDRCQLELEEQIRDVTSRLNATGSTANQYEHGFLDSMEAGGLHGVGPASVAQPVHKKHWPRADESLDDEFGL